MVKNLLPFSTKGDFINQMKRSRHIPVDFYTKEGQVLIHHKENASLDEIERLERFIARGVFYREADHDKLFQKARDKKAPDGLSFTRLFSKSAAEKLVDTSGGVFNALKNNMLEDLHIEKAAQAFTEIYLSFEKHPDMMTGLLNIIELLQGDGSLSFNVEVAVKRAAIAMALKTRGLKGRTKASEVGRLQAEVGDLMMAALLCDVGKAAHDTITGTPLIRSEMRRIQKYPFISYSMIARNEAVSSEVKRLVLNHRRPLAADTPNNNYPGRAWLERRLKYYAAEVKNEFDTAGLLNDIDKQISYLRVQSPYDEDINILAVASDFASLTSKMVWRGAHEPVMAVQQMINQNFYSYSYRAMREFLDYVSISLCDNQMIIRPNDFVIVCFEAPNSRLAFEAARVNEVNRLQSRPILQRFARVHLQYDFTHKLCFAPINIQRIEKERSAEYNLDSDFSRKLVYVVNRELDAELYEHLQEVAK